VVLRELWNGRVWRANAARVVDDGPERTVLWLARGSVSKFPVRGDGSEIRIPCDDWILGDRRLGYDAIAEFHPGARHSVWTFRANGLDHWYVNFEQPLERCAAGFQFKDEKLDLVVRPDGSWRWKDEDELEQAAALGIVNAEEVRAEAARVLAVWPFPTGWEAWQPDPTWDLPDLPQGWDET
jgi:predicted RNA-binding protein associated with RNAse of E/G family